MSERDGIELFRDTAKRWRCEVQSYLGLHFALGLGTIALSTYLAATGTTNIYARWALAFLASALTFLAPKITAERYKDAYHILSIMIGRYDHDLTYTYDHVAAAADRGHEIIKGVSSKGRRGLGDCCDSLIRGCVSGLQPKSKSYPPLWWSRFLPASTIPTTALIF